jgi:hypothetical protein
MVDITDGITNGTDGIAEDFKVRACPLLAARQGLFCR